MDDVRRSERHDTMLAHLTLAAEFIDDIGGADEERDAMEARTAVRGHLQHAAAIVRASQRAYRTRMEARARALEVSMGERR